MVKYAVIFYNNIFHRKVFKIKKTIVVITVLVVTLLGFLGTKFSIRDDLHSDPPLQDASIHSDESGVVYSA